MIGVWCEFGLKYYFPSVVWCWATAAASIELWLKSKIRLLTLTYTFLARNLVSSARRKIRVCWCSQRSKTSSLTHKIRVFEIRRCSSKELSCSTCVGRWCCAFYPLTKWNEFFFFLSSASVQRRPTKKEEETCVSNCFRFSTGCSWIGLFVCSASTDSRSVESCCGSFDESSLGCLWLRWEFVCKKFVDDEN